MDDFYLEKGLPKRFTRKVHHLPKANLKYGTIVKSIQKGPDGLTLADLSFNDGITPRSSGTASNRSTEFMSLNKKGRWRLVDQFRNEIEDWNDQYDNVRVSASENQDRFGRDSAGRATCTALHTVEPASEDQDDEGQPVHRYAKRKYAFLHTFTDKPKPPKKAQRGRRRQNAQQDAAQAEDEVETTPVEDPDAVHVMYSIWKPVDSVKMQRMRRRHEDNAHCTRHEAAAMSQRKANARYYEPWEEDDPEAPFVDADDDLINAAMQETLSAVTYSSPTPHVASLTDFLVPAKIAKRDKRLRNSRSESSLDGALSADADWSLNDDKERVLLFDFEDISISSGTASDDDQDDAVVVPPQVAPVPAMRVFEMIGASFYLYTDSLKTDRLAHDFGSAYHECACLPRRFCVDISNAVTNVLSVTRQSALESIRTKALCIVEVLPKAFDDMDGMAFEEETTLCRVYVNGHFTDQLSSLYLNTLNPAEAHRTIEVVTAATKLIGTLPLECLTFASQSTTKGATVAASNVFHEVPACFLRAPTQSLTSDKASSMVLTQQYAPKLQRQLTTVECFSEWFGDYSHLCGICFEPVRQEGIALAKCQHWFCNSCWNSYLREGIRNGQTKLRCPEFQCDMTVDYDLLCAIIPLPLCEVYASQLRDLYMQANADQWLWCPNERCGRVVHKEATQDVSNVLACECGFVWCPKCNQKAHWPISCEEFKLYTEKIKANGDEVLVVESMKDSRTDVITDVRVKRCPHCSTVMEKGQGCSHMLCRCGKSFCWVCLRPLEGHNADMCGWVIKNNGRRKPAMNFEESDKFAADDLAFHQRKDLIKRVEVKPCPHCRTLMEKGFGCIHMTCRCGKAFCWGCLQPWESGEAGTRHYNCPVESPFGFEKVELVDISRRGDVMSDAWYKRCLGHHHALNTHEIARVHKRVLNCLHSYKKISADPPQANDEFTASSFAQNLDVRANFVSTYHTAFLSLYRQVHYFLEYTLVWLYFRRKKSSYTEMKRIEWLTSRLNFILLQLEDALTAKDAAKVQRLLDNGFEQLSSLISHMVAVKRQDADETPSKVA